MSRSIPLMMSLLLGLATVASPCLAQTKPGEIKGVDAMGDKSRSAQDGWSQAPVPREQSAAKDAPDPGGNSIKENADRPVPPAPPPPHFRDRAAGAPGAPHGRPVRHQSGQSQQVKKPFSCRMMPVRQTCCFG